MDYLRRAGRAVVEQRQTMVTLSLLVYISIYLAVSFGGINFQSQPALATYHQGPPSASLVAPSDGALIGSVPVDLQATGNDPDNTNLDITFFVDGSNVGTETVSDETTATHPESIGDGSHTWYAQVCDQAGDCTNSGTRSLTVDTTAPSVSVSRNLTRPTDDEQVRITADAADATTNVQQIRIYVDGSLAQTCTVDSSSASCTADVGPYAQGSTHNYYAEADDEVPNTGSSATESFTVNTYPDEPTNPDPADGATITDNTPDLNVTYTDPDGDNGFVDFYVDGSFEDSCNTVSDGTRCGVIASSLSDGAHTWYAVAEDSYGDRNQSQTWSFTVDTSANTQITGPSETDWQTEPSFSVSVNDDDDGTTCEYRIDDGNDGSFETGWTSRSCPDGGFTVDVGSGGDCTVEGTDECHVEVRMTDGSGNTATDTADFDIDHSAPSATCNNCDSPDPVKSGNDVSFSPSVSDTASGTDLVEICQDSSCGETYCTYSPDSGESSCGWPTPDADFGSADYCLRATDQVGHQSSVQCGTFNFTWKKWVGDSCQADRECLLGACSDGVCQVTVIPPPSIVLTSFEGSADIRRAAVGAQTYEERRTIPEGRTRTVNMTLSNPLAVPDRLTIAFSGSAVERGIVAVEDVDRPGLSCTSENAQCTVSLGPQEQRAVQVPIRGVRPSRGLLDITATSTTSEKSASIEIPIVVKQADPFVFLRSLFSGLF